MFKNNDYMELGPTPLEESCAQVGADNYFEQARKECRAYIAQLRRVFGAEPEGARLVIRGNSHDFGTYYEVAVKYDCDDEKATRYAFKLEAEQPATWDAEAKAELGIE